MTKFRLGVVGLGHRGRNMFKLAADSFPDLVIPAAACDLIPSNWYETKFQQDKPMCESFPETVFYEDFHKMLDEAKLDVLLVETGADVHAQFCADGLSRNINVMSDIPVVANLEEADMLWEVAKKSKAMFSTGANPNEAKFSVMLKDLYQRGFLGKPYCMEAEYIHWSKGGAASKFLTENGNWRKLLCPIRYCTHSLGPLLAIMEEDLTEVSCFGTGPQAPIEYYGGFPKDDMQCAQFRSPSGVVVRLMRNGRCRAKIGNHAYRVFGTEGYFERTSERGSTGPKIRYNSTKFYSAQELLEQPGEYMPMDYADNPKATGHGGMDYALLDHFFQALATGGPAPISLREGLRMTIPGIYAEMSAKQGGKVLEIKYPWNKD